MLMDGTIDTGTAPADLLEHPCGGAGSDDEGDGDARAAPPPPEEATRLAVSDGDECAFQRLTPLAKLCHCSAACRETQSASKNSITRKFKQQPT